MIFPDPLDLIKECGYDKGGGWGGGRGSWSEALLHRLGRPPYSIQGIDLSQVALGKYFQSDGLD